jgi:type VI secretion system protein ImpH
MSTTGWRKSAAVVEGLLSSPFDYSFVQAVRLLERAASYRNGDATARAKHPVARYIPPSSEVVRFHATQSLSFPSAEISGIDDKGVGAENHQWHMHVTFMGLTGANGALPHHYSEMILRRLKMKDRSMMSFFDLFNHRLISLFFQASAKYCLPLEYERKRLAALPGSHRDSYTRILLALIGLGTPGLDHRLFTKDESLVYYSGLFTKKVRTATGLKQILENHFSIPVYIKEFIGQWQYLIDDVRTRLPSPEHPRGQNSQLGKSTMLGRKGWFAQGKIQIILGPLSRDQLHSFAPGTTTLKALDEVVRLYLNFESDFEFVMRIRRSDILSTMRLTSTSPPVMGWNTWLSPKANNGKWNDTFVDIPVSSRRLL